ncbi:mRNA processing protein [Schizosaccharomyces japonicus yFS275]|uniref:mRNA processing protein n=1 Tax=Schizosaccharomyces japonicus (strain yFS275 / FY16936) TaxID=402676 RepID=B6JVM0_SCHJY|nr:mRNA processing protein [Schizosaccharomyces japonicus yFS275]EEB05421.1 mRNA processing protein [Schizosaccharomyces japonicus yFS275]
MLSEHLVNVGRINVFLPPKVLENGWNPRKAADLPFELPIDVPEQTPVSVAERPDCTMLTLPCSLLQGERSEGFIPLEADELNESLPTTIICRKCNSKLATVSSWKNLPASNWQEFIDCWACHTETPAVVSANPFLPTFAPASVCFALLWSTYANIKKVNPLKLEDEMPFANGIVKNKIALCYNCGEEVGGIEENDPPASIRVHKFAIKLLNLNYPPLVIFSSTLLSLRKQYSVHKFVILSGDKKLWVWCMTPYLNISLFKPCSALSSSTKLPVMKLMFRREAKDLHFEGDDWMDIVLPKPLFCLLQETLKVTNKLYPASARKIGPWRVGLVPLHKE